MPRLLSASVEESSLSPVRNPRQNDASHHRLLHVASSIELRNSVPSEFFTPLARKRRGLQQSRRAASACPLSEVSDDIAKKPSRTHNRREDKLSLTGSPCGSDRYALFSTGSGSSHAEIAYPSPPLSEDGECEDLSNKSTSSGVSVDSFPFPLNPVPLPPLKSPAAFNLEVPQTPYRSRTSASIPVHTPTSSPDRYISNRSTPHLSSDTFRTSKSPHQLSPAEKLLRHNVASPDPFGPLVLPGLRILRSPTTESPVINPALPRPPRPTGTTNVVNVPRDPLSVQNRQASTGAVWNIGGLPLSQHQRPVRSVSNGRGGFISGGSNAPMYTSRFFDNDTSDQDQDLMEARLAAALDIDQTRKVLDISRSTLSPRSVSSGGIGMKRKNPYVEPRTRWVYGDWVKEGSSSLLDAPGLRDDYYCTVLAYCHSARTIAVGLGNRVYLWSEAFGVRYPPDDPHGRDSTYVTSLSFSSTEGGHSILAMGRNSGHISLWSIYDPENVRFESRQPNAVACVAFKPVVTRRPSQHFGHMTSTEEILVGDEMGHVYYYAVEWRTRQEVDIHGWTGAMILLAKISIHTQQVCGLAWSADGEHFATGANDNACCLFVVKDVLTSPQPQQNLGPVHRSPFQTFLGGFGLPNFIARSRTPSEIMGILANGLQETRTSFVPGEDGCLLIGDGGQKHKWVHSAAIKAIAFCPWQRGLIATGGGSNDRAIHFYHTFSGACLATINVHAQVTSLIWSTTRREIVATFGYAQPEHPYRVAVFSWPECRQVVAIPWANEMRALYAIAYPGGPGETNANTSFGQTWYSRTREEGCIVVACSDESVKFHEIWSGTSKSTGEHMGLLGGSQILEGLESMDIEGGEVIR